MYGSGLNYRNLMIALLREKRTVTKILKGYKKYEKILLEINKHDIDDYNPLPKQKEILSSLGLKRNQLISMMREMYDKVCASISRNGVYQIKETEIQIYAESIYTDQFWTLSPDCLAYFPSPGDRINIPFFNGSHGYFQVKEITHQIENQKHYITIFVDNNIE